MPACAQHLFHEGTRHLGAGDYSQAEQCFRAAIDEQPGMAEAHANLAWLLAETGDSVQADVSYGRALDLAPGNEQIRLNHGAFLAELKRFPEAQGAYAMALQRNGSSAKVWSNLGALYAQMNRFADAKACCRKSISLDPAYAKAHTNLSYLLLREGRFEEGLKHYEFRPWQTYLSAPVDGLRWSGEALEGRSILVAHEAGYGDMIQFCRYAALLRERGAARISMTCPPALMSLFGSLHGVDELLPSDQPLPRSDFDFWVSMMSLPFHCGTRFESVPGGGAYLSADPVAAAHWASRLPTGAPLVGLVWKGNPLFENDADRSLPSLDELASLGEVDAVRFVSLQKGPGEDEALRHTSSSLRILPFGHELADFADTAALIANLDLVITVDTAVAHLAAAIGKPCWIMLPDHMTDWRWLAGREDSPWYPGTVRLFRQAQGGDWSGVAAEVKKSLEAFVAERFD